MLRSPDVDQGALASFSTPFWCVDVEGVWRRFGDKVALRQVSLQVARGEIRALLGPNGAGKTTLLRILAGLTDPTSGHVRLMGHDVVRSGPPVRHLIGLVPSGDRTFYLRISGLENLVFFARLNGMRYRQAVARAREVLAQVDLIDAMHLPAGTYSHGMQNRLSVARALLPAPPILLIDEATHDLDPENARRVREMIRDAAGCGSAVVWATQRVDEIRGFADRVTLLNRGEVRFTGTVPQLMAHSVARRYLLRLRNGRPAGGDLVAGLNQAIGSMGVITPDRSGDATHCVLSLAEGAILGDALAALAAAHFQVLACQEERSEIEQAFLRLTGDEAP